MEKNIFLIYITKDVFKSLLNFNNKPKKEDIEIHFKLRNISIKYYTLLFKIFINKKNLIIPEDINNYFESDEFAFKLNRMITNFISNNKQLSIIEKLALLTNYNPYYLDSKYSDKVSPDFLDFIVFDNVDDFVNRLSQLIFLNQA